METERPPSDSTAETAAPSATDPPSESSGGPTREESAAKAFRDAATHLAEIGAYISYYLSAKADGLKLGIRHGLLLAVFPLIALLAVLAIVIAAVVILLVGIASGLGAAMGGRIWLGQIIVGAVVVIVIPLAIRGLVAIVFAISRRYMVEKYESRKQEQRARFGHDIQTRAEQADD